MKQEPEHINERRIALIALGSNAKSEFGDVEETVLKASVAVGKRLGGNLRCSPLYRTPAFPAGAGPDFVNAALAVETQADVAQIMAVLHQIEADAGRVRDVRWGPRTLDLDLIGLGDAVCPDPATYAHWRDLPLEQQKVQVPDATILPHPRFQDRSFVLVPLADVAPDWVHPVSGLRVSQMLAARPASERAEVVPLHP